MIVLYLKKSDIFLQAIPNFPETKEEDDKLWIEFRGVWKVAINDLTKAGYKEYPDQLIDIPRVWNEDLDDFVEQEISVKDLNLRDFTALEIKQRNNSKRDIFTEVDELKDKVDKLEKKEVI